MNKSAHKLATAHPSCHGEDGSCEGGWDGYPSDLQTTLQKKFYVDNSEDRDRTEQSFDSETLLPVSSRTRERESRRRSDRGAAEHRVEVDCGESGRREDSTDAAATRCDGAERAAAPTGDGATKSSPTRRLGNKSLTTANEWTTIRPFMGNASFPDNIDLTHLTRLIH